MMRHALIAMMLLACDPHTANHPVRPDDEEAWKGQPVIELEKHGKFSTLEKQERTLSDGTHWWVFQQCRAGYVDCTTGKFATTDGGTTAGTCPTNAKLRCCEHQFTVHDGIVTEYRARGECTTNCEMRPPEAAKTCRY